MSRRHSGSLHLPFISRWLSFWRRVRGLLSRDELSRRILRPSAPVASGDEGLILIQIDGLARAQFERAIEEGKMPFLKRLLNRENYQLRTLYSGLPSTTAAVQAELFYGRRCAVPAHAFGNRQTGEVVSMLNSEKAEEVERQVSDHVEPLLKGGSAYSNIYTGGASEPHFCAASLGWGDVMRRVSIPRMLAFAALNAGGILRAIGLGFIEFGLAIGDCIRGLAEWKRLWEEVKFIPSRVGVAVLLRELMTIHAVVDILHGLPVVQLNFLGYDEHAHLRGPGSKFAHWTLRQIDVCIRRIWRAADRSSARRYQVWIYSDHGQESVTPYDVHTGHLITDVVRKVFAASVPLRDQDEAARRQPRLEGRSRYLLRGAKSRRHEIGNDSRPPREEILVAAIGPLGHIYFPSPIGDAELVAGCRQLAESSQVPLVLVTMPGQKARAWTDQGSFLLPDDAAAVFGHDHPFLEEVARDLVAVCEHPEAGEIVIAGWRHGIKPLTFVFERGAHGAAGPHETSGFLMVPQATPLPHHSRGNSRQEWVRPDELREAGLHALHRGAQELRFQRAHADRPTLRVMTYNIHSGMGLDGRLSLARIARVLSQCDADVIALQELDARRPRSESAEQARELARMLGMEFYFHPALTIATEDYGDAILSRLPMRLIKGAALPGSSNAEPRGALWAEVEFQGEKIQIINTHFGLGRRDKLEQARTLIGDQWLQHPDCQSPVILCGDFNSSPRSAPYRAITTKLRDVQTCVTGRAPQPTWFSGWPLFRIDHIFVSPELTVDLVDVPRTTFIRSASDHLPLIVDLHVQTSDKLTSQSVSDNSQIVGSLSSQSKVQFLSQNVQTGG